MTMLCGQVQYALKQKAPPLQAVPAEHESPGDPADRGGDR